MGIAWLITAKTAKAHVTRSYRKLKITRRGDLAIGVTSRLHQADEVSATATISYDPPGQKIGPTRQMRRRTGPATLAP